MPFEIVRRKLRIPVVGGVNIIDTGWVDALVYDGLVAVHADPHQRGRWTITLAKSGEGVYHTDSEREAVSFALELLKSADRRKLRIDFDHKDHCPEIVKEFLIGFVAGWGNQRLHYIERKLGQPLGEGVLFAPDGKRII